MIDFSKLMASQNSMQVEPRNIFMGLPTRDKRYEYPRDVQTEVWKQWYEIRPCLKNRYCTNDKEE